MPQIQALTGPAAAALWKLDGFRGQTWPALWCSPRSAKYEPGIIRPRARWTPTFLEEIPVAPVELALRHLDGVVPPTGMDRCDLVEFALEHALRDGHVNLSTLGSRGGADPGDALLREVLARRPKGEPPTGSYAETEFVQRLRPANISVWRQVPIIGGVTRHRADFMVPYHRRRRPTIFRPEDGLLLEIDSREFHDGRFEEDHARDLLYDELGYRWLSFTPRQIQTQWPRVLYVIKANAEAPEVRRRTRRIPTQRSA